MKLTEWLEKFEHYLYFGALGAFAALVGYLYQLARKEGVALSFMMVATTAVVGFYLGMLFGGFLPSDMENRDALVLLVGATGLKGFEIVVSTAKTVIPAVLSVFNKGQPPPGDGG
ncbi:hypothetical protein D9M69_434410 [compost metagenome]